MSEFDGIVPGKPVTYTHEQYTLTDSKGVHCKIRASFDKDRFFLRSAHIVKKVEEGITHSRTIPDLIISNKGTEHCDTPHREEAGDY